MFSDPTKYKILKALENLMEGIPLEKITVTNVCTKAEVSRPTFYYHFENIYDIFDWFMREHIPHPEKAVSTGFAPSPAACALEICGFFKKHKKKVLEFRRVYPLEIISHTEAYFTEVFGVLLPHVFPSDVPREDLEKLVMFLSIAYTGFIEKWFNSGMELDLKGMFTGVFNAIHVGAPADAFEKIVDNIPASIWKPQ